MYRDIRGLAREAGSFLGFLHSPVIAANLPVASADVREIADRLRENLAVAAVIPQAEGFVLPAAELAEALGVG